MVPEKLSGEQKDLLKKFAEVREEDPRAGRDRLVGLTAEMVYHGAKIPDGRDEDAL